MLRTIRHCILVLTLLSCVSHASELSDFKADIEARHNGVIDLKAKGTMHFELSGDGKWEMSLSVKGGPSKSSEVSKGILADGQFLPTEYERRTKILFAKEDVDWDFDWGSNTVTGVVDKKDYRHTLNQTVHDPMSYQIPLRIGLMNGETKFNYSYLRWNRPNDLSFEVIGEELLQLESGRVHTLILKQTKQVKANEKKLIWVAKDYDFIPVRFTTFRKDKIRDDVIITKLWIDGKAIKFDR
jgi:hypothetical protein